MPFLPLKYIHKKYNKQINNFQTSVDKVNIEHVMYNKNINKRINKPKKAAQS